MSLEEHDVIVGNLLPNDLVCYTDGSASPNPGPAGAGASIFSICECSVIDLGLSIGCSTNNLGELVAIGIVLRELLSRPQKNHEPTRVFLFTDSLYAASAVLSTKPPNSHSDTIRAIRALLVQVSHLYTVSFHWIRGHMDIGGNERADRIAKVYARLSVGIPTTTTHLSFVAHRTVSSWPYGLISVPFEAFLSHLPKACLPVVLQSSRVPFNDPTLGDSAIPIFNDCEHLTTPSLDVRDHVSLCDPSEAGLVQLSKAHFPVVVQSSRVPSNDPTLGDLAIPIFNDCVQGSSSEPFRVVVVHMPKACLPPVIQSPSDPFNDPNVESLSIVSLDACATGCTSPTVRSLPLNALESAHVIFFNCQHTSVHTGQVNANESLVLMGPESNVGFSWRPSNDGITNELNQPLPTIPDRQRHETRVAEPTQAVRYTLRSHARAARGRNHCVPVSFNDPLTVDKHVETSSVSTLNLCLDHPAWVPASPTYAIVVNKPTVSPSVTTDADTFQHPVWVPVSSTHLMTVDKPVESSSDSTPNLPIVTFQFGAEGGWRTLGKIPDVSGDTGTVIVDCPDPGVNEGLCFPLTFRHPEGDELDFKHA